MRVLPGHLLCLAALMLAACSPAPEPPLADYLQRLARSLQTEIEAQAPPRLQIPARRNLDVDLPGESIDLLDLLSLRSCELSITIGKLNSSLGKMAAASQRLLLELEFLALAPPCIASLADEDAVLADTLRRAVTIKRRQLPARIWRATLGSPEFRAFWKRPRALGDYPAATGNAVPTAIARLDQLATAWLAGDYLVGHDELELLLAELRRGDGGALLQAFARQHAGLSAANRAIAARTADAPICFGERPSPEGRVVDTVVRKYFAGRVQPWSVKLERRRLQLMPPLRSLEQRLASASPGAYADWQQRRDAMLATAVTAPRRHANALAGLLETCGLRPGQSLPGG